MKKIIILFLILLIPLFPKAELSAEQRDDVAAFAKNMILKGNGNEHKNGRFAILAYNQGTRREGFYNKLSQMGKDYRGVNTINAKKWTFDCSSFAAYVYYHTLGVQTTYHDGHPYVVSKFVEDAQKGQNFYFIMNNVSVSSIDYNRMQKGDLVIIVGSHIMVYVGDRKIAHFTPSAITHGENLGAEVIDLGVKYPNTKVSVIRLKNGIVPASKKANTIITWPDTGKNEDISDRDDKPIIKVTYQDIIQKEIEITVNITDDKGLTGYKLSQETPTNYESINRTKTFTKKEKISENGTYYIFAKDTKGQVSKYEFKISNLDNTKPTITDIKYDYHHSTQKFDIEIIATDTNKIMYSLDKSLYQDSNKFINVSIGEHLIEVLDVAGNTTEYKLNLSSDLIPTLELNYDKNYRRTITVTINANDASGINGFAVTRDNNEPLNFNSYSINQTYQINANGTYYFWIKNNKGIVINKNITINNIDNIPPTINNVDIKRNFSSFEIIIDASDNQCGMGTYSIDGTNYQENNTFNDVNTINETIYVKDKCNNIATYKVDLNNLPTINYGTIILIVIIIVVVILIINNLLSIQKKRS